MFENPTVNLSALCNSCAKIACCSSPVELQDLCADSSNQNASQRAIRLVYPPFLCKLHSSSNPTNKNLTELGLETQYSSISVTIQN